MYPYTIIYFNMDITAEVTLGLYDTFVYAEYKNTERS